MAVFTFETPDGRRFGVEAPDAQTAISAWQSQDKAKGEPTTGVVEDYAKGIGSGLVEGAEYTVGAPGDIQSAFQAGGNWLGNQVRAAHGKPPLTPEQQAELNKQTGIPFLPTSHGVANFHRPITNFTPYEPERAGARYAKGAATFVPMAVAAGAPGGIRAAIASGGRYGAVPGATAEAGGDIAVAGYGEDARLYGQVAGALGGPMVASLGKRAITPFPASATHTDAANYLRQEGVTALTAGQRTGSHRLRYRESQNGGPGMAAAAEQAGEQYTAAALRRAGINGTRVLPDVVKQGLDDIGREFDRLGATNTLAVDTKFANDVRLSLQTYNRLVSQPNRAPAVLGYVQEIANASASGKLAGDIYTNLRSRIMTDAREVSDAATARALRDLAHDLDDAMERSIRANNPADLGAFKEARRLYKNMLVIDHAAGAAGPNVAAGILSPAQLRMGVQSIEGRRARSRGYSDFDELVRAGEIAMTPMPNSGTGQRLGPIVQMMAGGGTGFQAGGGTEGDWSRGLAGAALGALLFRGGPMAAHKAAMTRPGQWYLSNQWLPRTVADPRSAMFSVPYNATIPLSAPLGTPALPAPR